MVLQDKITICPKPKNKGKLFLMKKNSVFDSEEINFYYDFVDVHSGLELNWTEAKLWIAEYPMDAMLNNTQKFAQEFQQKLLDRN